MDDRPHLVQRAERNIFNTVLCIAAVALLFAATGWALGSIWDVGIPAAVAGFLAALVSSAAAYYSGDQIVLSLTGAREASRGEVPELLNVVEEMSIASGLPMPRVHVIRSPASNAFATGRDPAHASIAVTTGLMEILNRNELQAVIGHEMSHVRQRDTLYAVVIAVLVGSIVTMTDLFWRSVRYSDLKDSDSDSDSRGKTIILVVGLLLAILAPILAQILQMAMSRQREYLADLGGAELTRNPEGLAKALEKISRDPDRFDIANRGVQHLFIVNPVDPPSEGERGLDNLLRTHPPVRSRIRILRELANVPVSR